MQNVTRWIRWYDPATDTLVGEVELGSVSVEALQTLFASGPADPMFDCFPVRVAHVPHLEKLIVAKIEIEQYDYFLEADAVI